MSAHALAYAQPSTHELEDLVALAHEWARLDIRVHDLEEQEPLATVAFDWIRRRQSTIRDIMLSTPADTMAGVGAKHRVATAHCAQPLDDELLESAENDVVRLVYG